MRTQDESFFGRWSRLKQDAASKPAPVAKSDAAPAAAALPPLESLTFDSDFGAFMAAKVDEGIRRAALKKLFGDPRFNVMDGLDTYIDDYTKNDPIPEEMLKRLEHARSTFQGLERPKDEPQMHDEPQLQQDAPRLQQQDEAQTHTAQSESDAQPETQEKETRSGDSRQDA